MALVRVDINVAVQGLHCGVYLPAPVPAAAGAQAAPVQAAAMDRVAAACPLSLIVLNTFEDSEADAVAALVSQPCVMLAVSGADWERDFSPWPAPGLRKKDPPFGGGAAAYLKRLETELIPAARAVLPFETGALGIAGYSMAGLFAAHALYLSAAFTLAASVSGSLWYDGWADWASSRSLAAAPDRPKIYVSLGDTEKDSHNARLASVQNCTERMAAYWKPRSALAFEMNKGGHFNEPEARTARAVNALLEMAV